MKKQIPSSNAFTRSFPLLASAAIVGVLGGAGARFFSHRPQPAQSSAFVEKAAPANPNITTTASDSAGSPGTESVEPAALDSLLRLRSTDRLQRLALFLPQANAAAVEKLARHFCDPKTEEEGDLSIRLVLARWAELDPGASLAFCRTIKPHKGEREWLISNAFETWARVDYAAALAAADTPRNRTSALLGLSSADPLGAFKELEKNSQLFRGEGNLPWVDLVSRLARFDPVRLAALVPHLPANYDYIINQAIAGAWSRKDPAAAAAWLAGRGQGAQPGLREWVKGAEASGQPLDEIIENLPTGPLQAALRAELLRSEARRDPEGALARTLALPKGFERQTALASLAEAASARGDWRAVLKLGAEMKWNTEVAHDPFSTDVRVPNSSSGTGSSEGYLTGRAFSQALRQQLAEGGDPAEVWSVLKRNGSNSLIPPEEVLKVWLARDPEAAAKAALGDTDSANRFGSNLARAWFEHDPAAAQRHWETLPDSSARQTFLNGLTRAHAARDPEGALSWTATLPDALRSQAQQTVLSTWASSNPAKAAAAVLAQPALQQPDLVANLISNMSQNDPVAAAPLLAFLPQDDTNQNYAHVYQNFTQAYARENARAASEWIASMPDGKIKDQSISGLVSHLSYNDPDYPAALAWAVAASEPSQRENLSINVFTQWLSRDASAAKAALQQSQLTPAQKEKLLSKP